MLSAECQLLLSSQQPDPAIKGPMALSKQRAERRRIHVVVHGRSIGAVRSIVNPNPCRPAVPMEGKLLFNRWIESKEMWQTKYARRVHDPAEVVHRRKREAGVIKQ